jgi:membrane-associated phospholipid phosphatase
MKYKYLILLLVTITHGNNASAQNATIETTGDLLLYTIPLTTLATTVIIKDPKGTTQFTKGFLLNAITVESLKLLIHKQRPNGFNNKSFPSGHTAITFQSAAFIQKRYGWKYAIPGYILACYTGYTRIQSNNHDIVDVFSGAVLGTGSAYLFTNELQKKNIQIGFSLGKNNKQFTVEYNF